MPTPADISSQMVALMQAGIPTLDTSIGQPIRSMIDVIAEVVSEQTADQYLLSKQYDISSKTGSDLDSYVAQFGFSRYPAKQAVGSVTFSVSVALDYDVSIAAGTQVATASTPAQYFAVLYPATLSAGQTSISVPVQAIIGGSAGNVSAGQITTMALAGISSITGINNPSALTGGADAESDDQLRSRFAQTFLRSMTGTESMYLGVALDDPAVTNANVLGSSETYVEQVQIISGTATSSVPDLAYYQAGSVYLGTNLLTGSIFAEGSQFTIASSGGTSPPVITVVDSTNIPDGVYEFQFDYVSTASRNLPTANPAITNRVDVYVNGSRPTEAVENIIFPATPFTFNNTDPIGPAGLNISQFLRTDGATTPVNGHKLALLSYCPIIGQNTQHIYIPRTDSVTYSSGSSTITDTHIGTSDAGATVTGTNIPAGSFVGTVTAGTSFVLVNGSGTPVNPTGSGTSVVIGNGTAFTLGTDYWLVNDVSIWGGSITSRAGIECTTSMATAMSGKPFMIDYNFNQVPQAVQRSIERWRLVATDVMVHQANTLSLDIFLGLVLSNQGSLPAVMPLIQTSVENYLSGLSFDGVISAPEILSLVQAVPGVSAARFLTSADINLSLTAAGTTTITTTGNTGASTPALRYGIQSVAATNEAVVYSYGSGNIRLDNKTVPSLFNIYGHQFTYNNFGSV